MHYYRSLLFSIGGGDDNIDHSNNGLYIIIIVIIIICCHFDDIIKVHTFQHQLKVTYFNTRERAKRESASEWIAIICIARPKTAAISINNFVGTSDILPVQNV